MSTLHEMSSDCSVELASNRGHPSFRILLIGWFASTLAFTICLPFIPSFLHDRFGMSSVVTGFIFAVIALGRLVSQPVAGAMVDRVGYRSILVWSQIVRAAALVCLVITLAIEANVLFVAMLIVLDGISGGAFQLGGNAAVSATTSRSDQLTGFAKARVVRNMAWALGPVCGGLISGVSYELLFLCATLLALSAAAIIWILPDRVPLVGRRDYLRLRTALREQNGILLFSHSLLSFVIYLVMSQLFVMLTYYAISSVGVAKATWGVLCGMSGVLIVFLQVPVAKALSGFGISHQLVIGSLFLAVGYALIGLGEGVPWLALMVLVVTLGGILVSPQSVALASDIAPPLHRGLYLGVLGLFVEAGFLLGPLYGGFLLDKFNDKPQVAWMLIGAAALIPALGYCALSPRIQVARRRTQTAEALP